ncbi:MAG: flagellar protein FliS, partial [Gammaproteobacteria bacterium]|nr:flagellar protein FliS [Gammaproteobacteria bacterium]
ANLDQLYDYMNRQLVFANLHNDVEKLNEVYELLGEIRAGWDGIKPISAGSEADIPASA